VGNSKAKRTAYADSTFLGIQPNYTSYDNQNTFIAEQHAPSPAFGKSEYTPYEGQNNFVPETRGPTPGVAVPNAVLPSLDTIPPTPAATPEVKATARKALISIETVYHRFTESRALRDSFDGHCRAYKNGDTTEAEFYMALYRLLYFNKAADLIPILKTLMPQSWKAEDVEWFDKAIEEDVERVGGLRSLRVKLVVAKTARKGRKGKKEGSLVVKLPIRGLGKRKKV